MNRTGNDAGTRNAVVERVGAETVRPKRAVILIEIGDPPERGLMILRKRHRENSDKLLLALVPEAIPALAVLAIEAGASGCLCDDASIAELDSAIQQLQNGFSPLCPRVAHAVLDALRSRSIRAESPGIALTPREKEILALLGRGHAYASVAKALGIGVGTVQTHVRRLYRKLEVSSKAEAAALAVRYGLVCA
jgi:DNA-binding NarL/FixJ family response regulator